MFEYSGGSLQSVYKYVWFYIFKRPFFKLKIWCVCVFHSVLNKNRKKRPKVTSNILRFRIGQSPTGEIHWSSNEAVKKKDFLVIFLLF